MTIQPKPQKVKITLRHDMRTVAVLGIDFQDARAASVILFKGQNYINSGIAYELKDRDHDDPDIDWRGHLVFDLAEVTLAVPASDEIVSERSAPRPMKG